MEGERPAALARRDNPNRLAAALQAARREGGVEGRGEAAATAIGPHGDGLDDGVGGEGAHDEPEQVAEQLSLPLPLPLILRPRAPPPSPRACVKVMAQKVSNKLILERFARFCLRFFFGGGILSVNLNCRSATLFDPTGGRGGEGPRTTSASSPSSVKNVEW